MGLLCYNRLRHTARGHCLSPRANIICTPSYSPSRQNAKSNMGHFIFMKDDEWPGELFKLKPIQAEWVIIDGKQLNVVQTFDAG